MRKVQVHDVLAVHAQLLVHAHVEDLARGHVAGHEVFVERVLLLEEVPGLAVLVRPHAPALATRRLAHQAILVDAGNGRGVDLDELAVGEGCALAVQAGGGVTGVDGGVRRLPEHRSQTARGAQDRVGGKRHDLHRGKVLGGDAAADAVLHDGRHELPALVLGHLALHLEAAHLLVKRVQKLLARRGARVGRAAHERAAETAKVQKALGRAVEHDAHAVEHVDERRSRIAHPLHLGLVRQEVAAVHRVVEVAPGGIVLALRVDGGVHAALRARGVRALHRHEGEQVDGDARLGDLERRHEAGQAAADDHNFVLSHE